MDGVRRGGDFVGGDHAGVRDAGRLSSGGVDGHDPGRHPDDRVRDPAVRRARPLWRTEQKLRAAEICRARKGGRAGRTHKPAMVQLHRRRGTGWRTVSAGDSAHLRRTQPAGAPQRRGHNGIPAADGVADRSASGRHSGRLDGAVAGFADQRRVGPSIQRGLPDRDGKVDVPPLANRGAAGSRAGGTDVHSGLGTAVSLVDVD